ncbi:uncharacterized protein LACBIDRAFT_331036 [Laccaria bicolor S238N-H82]|uniref:Predicted protein n=1 Tax=Laccaria bicolor (strain S238N-H82 / ATCC MYA-4686) TaxID=486041 RepID=B0DN82_LACBS|nr:uncharacterized protein LACBIDRAFT_331036 [Laccaria bicolor S238N-H82]EDR03828.1 predicted protein [Laccaria bicolor S238N-H82]|eukprot:XP_001885396.1 predicted protein [Laccaria bicolor S238N-H82]
MTKKNFAELELRLLHLPELNKGPISRSTTQHLPHSSKLPTDSTFLNSLHSHVNTWIKAIQAVTKLTRDVSSGTASQEINFWLIMSLERALEGIEAQLRSEEVGMVMDALRNAKKFRATDATDLVHKYSQLMEDFPLNDLLSSADLDKVHESLTPIFSHLNRKLKLSPYPICRALPLVKAILRDFNDVLLQTITTHRLAYTPYPTFERLLARRRGYRMWDDLIKEFTNVARELGTEVWVTAENVYNDRVSRVENQIIARLRDRLGTARNANEMFRVFSKFNALFVRPRFAFKTQYRFSEAYHMAQLRDLHLGPPQIERQLLTYMKHVKDVLSKGYA